MYESSCSYQSALDLKRASPIAQVCKENIFPFRQENKNHSSINGNKATVIIVQKLRSANSQNYMWITRRSFKTIEVVNRRFWSKKDPKSINFSQLQVQFCDIFGVQSSTLLHIASNAKSTDKVIQMPLKGNHKIMLITWVVCLEITIFVVQAFTEKLIFRVNLPISKHMLSYSN